MTVKVGVSDGTFTEVIEGLKEGDVIVVGTTSTSSATAAPAANPFAGPFGGGRR